MAEEYAPPFRSNGHIGAISAERSRRPVGVLGYADEAPRNRLDIVDASLELLPRPSTAHADQVGQRLDARPGN